MKLHVEPCKISEQSDARCTTDARLRTCLNTPYGESAGSTPRDPGLDSDLNRPLSRSGFEGSIRMKYQAEHFLLLHRYRAGLTLKK